jgi:hypothetical protein
MTRQVAIGAVIAFAATVLLFSVWSPSAPVVAPAPVVVQPAPPAAALERPVQLLQVKPLRPDVVNRGMLLKLKQNALLTTHDAGTTP